MGANRLPLTALRMLEAVGRHSSLARAAEELSVEPSAVSMQMKTLSQYIGAPMLKKSGRGVTLTPVARQLLPVVSDGLRKIEAALHAARESPSSGDFHISVLPSFLILWLIGRLATLNDLCAAHDRRLLISASKANVELSSGEYQACIRLGHANGPGLISKMLMVETLVPVCAPSMVGAVGKLDPGVLPSGLPLLNSRLDSWARWGAAEGQGDAVSTSVMVDDPVAVILSAENGLGLALARGSLAAASIAAGRLCQVGPAIPYRYSYYWNTASRAVSDPLSKEIFEALLASA